MCNLHISVHVCSLNALHPQFWNIFNNPNRDRKYSTFTSVIPKWNSLQFGIYTLSNTKYLQNTHYIYIVKTLCINCVIIVCIYSQILTENIGPSHFTLSFQNGPTIQFVILTKYALLQSLCIHCIIFYGNKS